ncbi:MAG: hypothetical protein JW795_22590 [Chitinivibrionales bacterium]|nr:hypothetical protein [Chitinivibrionales bacterium]
MLTNDGRGLSRKVLVFILKNAVELYLRGESATMITECLHMNRTMIYYWL